MTNALKPAVLTGVFSWDGQERRGDRYGAFTVDKTNFNGDAAVVPTVDLPALKALEGRRVEVIATVLDTRQSGHIGDIFHGFFPSTPKVGDKINLGVGVLRIEALDWSPIHIAVALEPKDGRPVFWYNPKRLYKLHDQTVQVTVTGTKKAFSAPLKFRC